MKKDIKKQQERNSELGAAVLESESSGNEQYEKPSLTCYGDVRDITLGPTPGLGESGNVLLFRNPP